MVALKLYPTDDSTKNTYLRTMWHQRAYLTLRDGILYRHWKDVPGGGTQPWLQLLLPPHTVPEVLQGLHSSPTGGHLGINKTLEKARARFYWPHQRYDVSDWSIMQLQEIANPQVLYTTLASVS